MIKNYFQTVWETIKNFSDFSSCATRKEFWGFVLFWFVYHVIACIVLSLCGAFKEVAPGYYSTFGSPLNWVFSLPALIFFVLPFLAVSVRRLHDSGRSGSWLFLTFLPLIGCCVIFIMMCLPSNPNSEYSDTFFEE